MKLPPLALTAPSLCPRCDAAAMFLDECTQCALPLRQCGSCLGVAGPFDRYCGFCGHELVLGEARSGAWRLWLAVALVPIVAALAIGISPLGQRAARTVASLGGAPPKPAGVATADPALRFKLSVPTGWTLHDVGGKSSLAILAGDPADEGLAPDQAMNLWAQTPKGPVVVAGRPAVQTGLADPNDPVAVLTAQAAALVTSPPKGYQVTVGVPVKRVRVGGRPAAEVVLDVTSPGGASLSFEKVYVAAPRGGLFLFQALVPQSELATVRTMLESLRLS